MAVPLIKATKISKVYRLPAEEIHAVRDVDVEIRAGEFVAIMGPSGSGKTTLLDILGCLDRISSGKLEVLGQDVSSLSETGLVKIRRGRIGFVFQEFLLIPTLTALENVELPFLFNKMPMDRAKARSLLDCVGLAKRANHLPKQLSGGERQRVAIARALITSPRIIFADEPTGNLDSKNGQQVVDILKNFNHDTALTVVLTTHNQSLGVQSTRLITLRDGSL